MRLLLAVILLALAACSTVPEAPPLPTSTGYLTQRTTRQLVEHWVGEAYPEQIKGRPIRFRNRHRGMPQIVSLTPAEEFSKDDPDSAHLGTVVMAHGRPDRSPLALTSHAWQFSSQPATIVARSEKDGSLSLTALDFREDRERSGLPVASNYRLPFHYVKKTERNPLAHLFALMDPVGWSDRRGFYLATEYDPEKIPLIFIHGLLSTPTDFETLAATLASKPDLWERYQFWFYFYPTGDPWVVAAANFREDFRKLVRTLDPEQDDRPLRQETTLIAHSMGGLISRLSLSEQPEILYQQYFNRPLEEIRLLPYQKKRLREQLLFEPLEEPARVIFLAVPHQGSGLARGPLLWLTEKLVRAPARILGTTLGAAQSLAFAEPGLLTQQGSRLLAGNAVSVSGLGPKSPALQALREMPIRDGVELHNIVATLTGNERGLGDWVVPYTSAAFEQADSQTIVRSGHWLIRDKQTAEVVARILRN
ncbi:esterase/lipase family protein [Roseibacillus ishigakijimensis]|uniref:Alpha/beta fold hydrolase n=1 Tax=Roseibacillus ishigakijimensis TaxID=454146 RepID=A0A934RTY3_9BACT|nr:alpha/beta fold hydrolase [Roseibacillus ishigakijimensis]MBK1834441.1 alpha/beta fold hydrolase [Roseibacillus ishigakijimensis]